MYCTNIALLTLTEPFLPGSVVKPTYFAPRSRSTSFPASPPAKAGAAEMTVALATAPMSKCESLFILGIPALFAGRHRVGLDSVRILP